MLKILHITPSLAAAWGGTTSTVIEIVKGLKREGAIVTLVTTRTDPEREVDALSLDVETKFFSAWSTGNWRYAPALGQFLRDQGSDYDVVHLHGLWLYPNVAGVRAMRRHHTPIVISPHGMLSEWALQHKKWRKRIYMSLIERGNLSRANTIHAITPLEAEHIRRIVPSAHIGVVPNAVDITAEIAGDGVGREKIVVFLGRIHRIKRIRELVDAFAALDNKKGWTLVVAGPAEDKVYLKELQQAALAVSGDAKVVFVGPLYGREKWELLRKAWVLVLPSYSEVIGMVNLEAAVCGTPSITTMATGLSDWEQGGGLLLPTADVTVLTEALRVALSWSVEERTRRGIASRNLVEREYSMEVNARRWMNLYRELVVRRP